jgi:hypothetical protein
VHVQALHDSKALVVVIRGLKLVPGDNAHEHWRVKAKRTKYQRSLAAMVLQTSFGKPPPLPLVVTITRVGKRNLDSDNLVGSAKYVRDGIADWVGVDDGNPGYTWKVEAAKGDYACMIRLEARNGD